MGLSLGLGLGSGLGSGLDLGLGLGLGDGHAVENFSMGVPTVLKGTIVHVKAIWRVTAEEAKADLGAGDCKNRR